MDKGKHIRRRLINAYVSSVASISLVLLLIGIAAFLLINAKVISDYFRENIKISVIMQENVDEDVATVFQSELERLPFCASTRLISREQGISEMAGMLGEDFMDVFQTVPIPVSIDVSLHPQYVQTDSLEVIRTVLSSHKGVDDISYQRSLVEALNDNLSRISLILAILVALLLFISFVLINNTVRLNVFSRRFTIHTMKMVGATRAFIRKPFMGEAALQGIFSSLFAMIMLLVSLFFVKEGFPQLFEVFSLNLLLLVFGIIFVSGMALCLLSTYAGVNKLVAMNKDDLYY